MTPLRFPALLETRLYGTSRSAPGTQNGGLSVSLGLTAWLIRIIYTVKVKPKSAVKRRKSARRYRLNSPTTRVNSSGRRIFGVLYIWGDKGLKYALIRNLRGLPNMFLITPNMFFQQLCASIYACRIFLVYSLSSSPCSPSGYRYPPLIERSRVRFRFCNARV